MSVLTRLAAGLLLIGLFVGLVLRWTIGRARFRPLLTALVLVPAALHAGYVAVHALGHHAAALGLLAYLAGAALVVGAGVLLGRRWIDGRGLWAALTPLVAGVAYGALPFALYSWSLRRQSIDLDVVPTALFLGACLFGSALLLPFAPGGESGSAGGWLGRLVRRR
ncbi:MAG: hypothetical protein P8Y13_13885 [Deinococcales bacterium]